MLISSRITSENIEKLNLPKDVKISINDGMLKYIRRHRQKFRNLESENK